MGRRTSSPPVYRQVEAALLGQIERGELRPGERLPTEVELARRWGVNRLTIRQAIGELARAGRVTVRQGSGTYVTVPPLVFEVALPPLPATEAEASSSAALEAQGRPDHVESYHRSSADDVTAAAVDALDASPLLRLDTITKNAGTPLVLNSYWLDAQRFPGIGDHATDQSTLMQVLREEHGVVLRHAWRSLSAVPIPSEQADLLDMAPGSPALLREGVNVDDDGRPTVYIERRMRGDRIRIVLRYETNRSDGSQGGGARTTSPGDPPTPGVRSDFAL